MSREINEENAVFFRNEFREARMKAYENLENYQELLFVIERLGSFLTKKAKGSLKDYRSDLKILSAFSILSGIDAKTFERLFTIIQQARNDALHQGAFARHLTYNLVRISLIFEDALEMKLKSLLKAKDEIMKIKDFMVSNPVIAELWQPLNFIRQQMLAHSFSCLPFKKSETWFLVSDYLLASYLRNENRKIKLNETLEDAIHQLEKTEFGKIHLIKSGKVLLNDPVEKMFAESNGKPVLVFEDGNYQRLVGIITPYDVL